MKYMKQNFRGNHFSFGSIFHERTHSNSKWCFKGFVMTGWRVGYIEHQNGL